MYFEKKDRGTTDIFPNPYTTSSLKTLIVKQHFLAKHRFVENNNTNGIRPIPKTFSTENNLN